MNTIIYIKPSQFQWTCIAKDIALIEYCTGYSKTSSPVTGSQIFTLFAVNLEYLEKSWEMGAYVTGVHESCAEYSC